MQMPNVPVLLEGDGNSPAGSASWNGASVPAASAAIADRGSGRTHGSFQRGSSRRIHIAKGGARVRDAQEVYTLPDEAARREDVVLGARVPNKYGRWVAALACSHRPGFVRGRQVGSASSVAHLARSLGNRRLTVVAARQAAHARPCD